MDLPMSRASAFLRRNRTTHSWYGDWSSAGCIMSQSCPSPQTLEQHMRNARKAMAVSSSFYQPRASAASKAASSAKADLPPAAGFSKSLPHASTSKGRAHYGRTFSSPGRGGAGVRNGGVGVTRSNSVNEGDARPRTLSYRSGSELPSSSASSPGPTTSVKIPGNGGGAPGGNLADRPPSASYSYDGGFFVTANNAHKDFFVIDPEWVSEDGTIQEEAEDGKGGATAGASASGKTSTTTQGRGGGKGKPKVVTAAAAPAVRKNFKRSKSAPPSNLRGVKNPITWQ